MKKRISKYMKITFWNLLRFILSPFIKVNNNLILFGTAMNGFTDNPKYLFLYILENDNQLFPIWVTDNKKVFKDLQQKGINVVIKDSFKAFLLAMQAKYFVFSHNIYDIFYFKRKSTVAINLWHGSPLKKLGYDSKVESQLIRRRKRFCLKIPYETWDFFVVAHEMWIPYFERSMKISRDKILPIGLPRNDILWEVKDNPDKYWEIKNVVFQQFGIDQKNKKVILYAPTFRDDDRLTMNLINETKKIIKRIKELITNTEYIFFIRFHPLKKSFLNYEDIDYQHIYDATLYEDMYELLSITDILISDYSSSIFDFTILERPIILYTFDYKEYIETRGGLYNTLDKNCFITVNNLEDLILTLNRIIRSQENRNFFSCSSKYNVPGQSSERILKFIKEHANTYAQ